MRLISVALMLILLAGCSSAPHYATAPYQLSSSQARVRQDLIDQYRRWKGVPYRLGGLDRQGIDCSGFVYRVFDELYALRLPRTTEQQIEFGLRIDRDQLQVADLVFFKTSWKVRHVGIYLGNGDFLHASTSRGVMISSLDNPYWQDHYLASRRAIELSR
ncbi:C40 family peptidase [Marinobacterium sp. D7]|uniref:NlpC/P60 family protein n=1 Tax=Marinobacterium ramblicola TaxID=2849041 RepID=UPI001C2DC283|nr:NlpC/P60 family protein [Marinobacterium ramblicola]MBV1786889.1 C40 family peptidase [Marinobacterium ramblicola]